MNGISCNRFAFADELKKEINDSLKAKLNISAFTEDSKEKELIRPYLVSHGMKKRESSNGYYWIDKIKDKVANFSDKKNITIITDVRFVNEVDWINDAGGTSVHISRQGNIPPNEEEKENDPKVMRKCRHRFNWLDFPEFPCSDARITVFNFLDII